MEAAKQQVQQESANGVLFKSQDRPNEIMGGEGMQSGTSIFDPVICELVYRWFSDDGAQVIDPFAGGSVRGIVASCLGRKYWGSELSMRQVLANREQVELLLKDNKPVYICGDSRLTMADSPSADLVFSCPPYGDLEVYSDDPKDLSTMEWLDFCESYFDIIFKSCARLKENRFACFVVGNYRAPNGEYRDLVGATVEAFCQAGLHYYNEAILVTAVGSLPIRITKQFPAGRKLGKTHQNILVFWKGDPSKVSDTTRHWKITT